MIAEGGQGSREACLRTKVLIQVRTEELVDPSLGKRSVTKD